MRAGIIPVMASALALLSTSCGEDASAPATAPLGSWEVRRPPYDGAWTHCDVQSDGTLWATVLLEDSKKAAVVRYENGGWEITEFEAAVTEALNDILMFDDGRGWACGNAGAILEYGAGRWSLTRLYNDLEYFHLAGYDSRHVWVNAISRPYGVPAIFFNDGTAWREAPKPDGFTSFGPIYMTAPDAGFMVGRTQRGDKILSLDGSSWREALTFNEPLHFYDLEGAGGVAYAVGERRLAVERLGRVYQLTPEVRDITPREPAPEAYCYWACYVEPGGGLWVTAAPYASHSDAGYKVLRWDGARWAEARVRNDTGEVACFFDVDFVGDAGWAVGGTTYALYRRP
jgi:hypothetical protein